jgi:hypothetical protein
MPIDPQVDRPSARPSNDQKAGAAHGPVIGFRLVSFRQRAQEPLSQRQVRIGHQNPDHRRKHARVGQIVADGTRVLHGRCPGLGTDAGTRPTRNVSARVQDGNLPPGRPSIGCRECVGDLLDRVACLQQVKSAWSQPWVGTTLIYDDAQAGYTGSDTRAAGNRVGCHGSSDFSGAWATADDRERHMMMVSRRINETQPASERGT